MLGYKRHWAHGGEGHVVLNQLIDRANFCTPPPPQQCPLPSHMITDGVEHKPSANLFTSLLSGQTQFFLIPKVNVGRNELDTSRVNVRHVL